MQKEAFNSYRLIIENDTISREQANYPTITLSFDDILQITEDKHGNLLVKGKKSDDLIIVYTQIEEYDLVKNSLLIIKPITQQSTKNILQKYPFIPALLSLGCMAVVYLSNNRISVAACGLSLIALMGWSFYKIRTSKQADSNLKRKVWLVLLVAAAVAAIVYYKVFAN